MTREEWLEAWSARTIDHGQSNVDATELADALELAGVFEPRPTIIGAIFEAGDDICRGDTVRPDFYGHVWSKPGDVKTRVRLLYRARNSAKRGEKVVVEEMSEKVEVKT